MADPRRTSTRRAVLGYDQLKQITKEGGQQWPDLLVKDYQGIIQDFVFLADTADSFELRIIANAEGIEINRVAIDEHVTSNSEHGVTGVNVGTEDFCTELIGGVVLLSELVNDAIESTQEIILLDIVVAPAAYDQVYTQTLADMANDTKAKHNQLVLDLNEAITQINDIIAKAKTAKQMVL